MTSGHAEVITDFKASKPVILFFNAKFILLKLLCTEADLLVESEQIYW